MDGGAEVTTVVAVSVLGLAMLAPILAMMILPLLCRLVRGRRRQFELARETPHP